MDLLQKLIVTPGSKVDLSKIDPNETFGWTETAATLQTVKNLERIAELQDILRAEHKHNVLVALMGMDCSGKDGLIDCIGGVMKPQGVRVVSFKKPTKEELKHHFLWRVERQMPGTQHEEKGEFVFFNRSQYEDVVAGRVHNLASPEELKKRYGKINALERKHTAKKTHIIKFHLHISKDEQFARLFNRLTNPKKHHKVSATDFVERQFWPEYQQAFETALTRCSTKHAPFYIIPANNKWFRNLVASQAVVNLLESLNMSYPKNTAVIEEVKRHYLKREFENQAEALNSAQKPANDYKQLLLKMNKTIKK